MKKDEVFKAGAESVAKPMEKKINDWADNIRKQNEEQKKEFDEFADALIEYNEKKEDECSNITVFPSFSEIEEDRDVAIILEIINKYYREPQYIKNADSDEVIKTINNHTRRISLTESEYDVNSISTLENKEEGSLILYALLCLLNEVTEEFPEELFDEVKGELYLANSKMKEIEKQIHNIASTYHIPLIMDFILGDTGTEECYDEEEKEITDDEINCVLDEGVENQSTYEGEFSELRNFITSELNIFQDKFIENTEKNIKKINKKIDEIDNGIAEETVIGVLKYNLITDIMFTTHAFYYKEKFSDRIEISYEQLLTKGMEAIDENIAIGNDENTKFSIVINENLIMKFEDDNFQNDILLSFYEKFTQNVSYEMLAKKDRYTLLADMSNDMKISYLLALFAMFDNKPVYKAEIYCLAKEIKCSDNMIMELDSICGKELDTTLDELQNLIPYPSFEQVGYTLFKDYIEIMYRYNIYKNEKLIIKHHEAEIIERITTYFHIDEPERTNFKNTALFLPKMAFERITIKEFEDLQKKITTTKLSKHKLSSILVNGGTLYLFGFIGIGILSSFNKVNDRINFYERQREVIKNLIQLYSDISELLDKSYHKDTLDYYAKMIDLLNVNLCSINNDIESESNKVRGRIINRVDKVKKSATDITVGVTGEAKNIAQNTVKEAKVIANNRAKEAAKFVGGFLKKKR